VPKRGSAAFPTAVARSWLSRYPVDLWKWRVPAVSRQVRALLADGQIDLCVADFLFAAVNVPFGGEVPVVLFEHNVEYLIWKRLSELETVPWRRALLEIEWRKLRASEASTCARADLTIAVSQEDRRRLAELAPRSRIAAIPTGVDTSYFTPHSEAERPAHLVFSGSMDWHPNEDAVVYFIDSILPRIRAAIPHASFSVVGRHPTDRLRAIAGRAGVHLTGTIDDVRPPIAEAAVYVVPLRAGGGTRLKIFEALAMGKAVVSTTVGAEGLTIQPDRHYIAADAPADFANAVVTLIRDPHRRRELGHAGRRLVEERYSWTRVACEFERRCEEVVEEHAGAFEPAHRRADLSRERSPRQRGTGIVVGQHNAVGWSHHRS
jgi:glycosyltransferase involved in cell wall biosynthesis